MPSPRAAGAPAVAGAGGAGAAGAAAAACVVDVLRLERGRRDDLPAGVPGASVGALGAAAAPRGR